MTAHAEPRSSSDGRLGARPGMRAPGPAPMTIDSLSRCSVTSPARSARSAWSMRSTGIPRPRQMDCMWPVRPPELQTTARAATMAS